MRRSNQSPFGSTRERAASGEVSRLERRISKLAEDKSNLELVVRLMGRVDPMPGLDQMVRAMLISIGETIGGTDIKLYYWVGPELRYADFAGSNGVIEAIDDPLVAQVALGHEFIEHRVDPTSSLLTTGTITGAWIWCFPLMVGSELIGIAKIENLHISATSLRPVLPVFFDHAALILSNEIRNHTRRLAEEALRSKTAELDSYFNTALELFCIADLDGRFRKLNPLWAEVLGYSLEELEGASLLDFVHREDLEVTRVEMARLRERQPVEGFCNRYRCKDGSYRWIEWHARPTEDLVFAAARDVTERRSADDRIRLAASVFAASQEGILISDADNHIVDVNPAFVRLTGYSREEVLGRDPRFLSAGRQSSEFYQEMWLAIASTGTWQGELWNRRKTGEVYIEALSIVAVKDEGGRLMHYVGVFSDVSRLKAHEAELDRLAHFDLLTGIPNRRLLSDRLDQALARARRHGTTLGVCYLDLDGFKTVNDRFGHEGGDQVLVEIARRLKSMSRGDDSVARLGGDEFVLLWNEVGPPQECLQALERILSGVAAPLCIEGVSVSVSASVGVTFFPEDNADSDSLLRHADHAMYAAKQQGKNRYQVFDSRLERSMHSRVELMGKIARGLEGGEFALYYQPKADVAAGRVIGVEALLRWHEPSLGTIGPKEFLPFIDTDALALKVGRWIVEQAVGQGRRWHEQGIELPISVNIFPRHLMYPSFVGDLRAAIASQWPQMPPGRLVVELVQSSELDDLASIEAAIEACGLMGVGFSLDDFGTGHSSLVYLRRLSVEELKVDRSFVRDMLVDPEDEAIVSGIIALGKAFGVRVVAEGVEFDEQAERLVALGCSVVQGFDIARPMPAVELEQRLGEIAARVARMRTR